VGAGHMHMYDVIAGGIGHLAGQTGGGVALAGDLAHEGYDLTGLINGGLQHLGGHLIAAGVAHGHIIDGTNSAYDDAGFPLLVH
jgi:hypothetical protein